MHTLAKPKRSWIDGNLPREANFQGLPSSFEHVHEQGRQQARTGNLPLCTFGMGYVKEKNHNVVDTSDDTLSALSLLSTLDPYSKSQLLVEYSKELHTCMILDDRLHEGSYSILDGVIYNHDRILLSISSKLKDKLLQRAYEEFNFSHTYSMKLSNIILRKYYWEGFERELYQH